VVSAGAAAAVSAVVAAGAGALVAELLLLASSPHAANATMVKAARPAASLMLLIFSPWLWPTEAGCVAAARERCCFSDDAELVAKHECGSAEQNAVVAE
jgi:hypothetical protein